MQWGCKSRPSCNVLTTVAMKCRFILLHIVYLNWSSHFLYFQLVLLRSTIAPGKSITYKKNGKQTWEGGKCCSKAIRFTPLWDQIMFCLGHFYIKGSIVHGCKVHVISVKMKSMSVTLFKILTISCCVPEALCHKLFNLPTPYNCVLVIYLCYLKSFWYHFLQFLYTATAGKMLFLIKQFICKLFLHSSPTVAVRSHIQMWKRQERVQPTAVHWVFKSL